MALATEVQVPIHGFSVPFSFPVLFANGIWRHDVPLLVETCRRAEPDRHHRLFVVIDEQVAKARPSLAGEIGAYVAAHDASLQLATAPVVVPGGEAVKNDLTHTFGILQRLNDVGLDRQSFVVVIGGGAVLDMVSFAAAICHRGIRVIRMPSTVLAQADSGIAVKNSVNLFGKKNFIGTFVPPFAVINDIDLLATLPLREKIAGVSEAVKVALLRCPMFFKYIERHTSELAGGDVDVLGTVVQRSAELHLAHICGNGDPFELGSARPLDFGHWSAHKLESMMDHRIRHGEAVAIGMALDLTYSVLRGYLHAGVKEQILDLLEQLGLPVWDEAMATREPDGSYAIVQGLREFREHLGGELHVTLLREIGQSFEVTAMDEQAVTQAIRMLALRSRGRPGTANAPVFSVAR